MNAITQHEPNPLVDTLSDLPLYFDEGVEYETLDQALERGHALSRAGAMSRLYDGDWIDKVARWGDHLEIPCKVLGITYNTAVQRRSIAKRIRRDLREVILTHTDGHKITYSHQRVLAKLPAPEQVIFANKLLVEGWTVDELSYWVDESSPQPAYTPVAQRKVYAMAHDLDQQDQVLMLETLLKLNAPDQNRRVKDLLSRYRTLITDTPAEDVDTEDRVANRDTHGHAKAAHRQSSMRWNDEPDSDAVQHTCPECGHTWTEFL